MPGGITVGSVRILKNDELSVRGSLLQMTFSVRLVSSVLLLLHPLLTLSNSRDSSIVIRLVK